MSDAIAKIYDPIGDLILGPRGEKAAPAAPAAPPPIPPPAVAPVQDDAAIQAAKKRQLEAAAARSGRASTILSDSGTSDTLGG